MATVRQKRLARAVVKNMLSTDPLNKEQLVVSVGYSELSGIKKATEILNSKGTVEELNRLGFDSEKAREVVGELLQHAKDPSVRLNAAKEIFKVNGDYAPEKRVTVLVETEVDPELLKLADQLDGLKRND